MLPSPDTIIDFISRGLACLSALPARSWHLQHPRGPVQHLVQIPRLAAMPEPDHGVKAVFHLPLTCVLMTLQWYYCLTVLTLSHLAASQITPSNTARSCVMNKSLFHHGLSCIFSLNSQNYHTFLLKSLLKNPSCLLDTSSKYYKKGCGLSLLVGFPLTLAFCLNRKCSAYQKNEPTGNS